MMNMNFNLFLALVALFASSTTAATSTQRRFSYQQRAPLAYADLSKINNANDTPRKNHPSPPTLLNEQEQKEHTQLLEQRRQILEQYSSSSYKSRQEKLEKLERKAKTVQLTGASSGKTFKFSNRAPTYKKNKKTVLPVVASSPVESPYYDSKTTSSDENVTSSTATMGGASRFSVTTAQFAASRKYLTEMSM